MLKSAQIKEEMHFFLAGVLFPFPGIHRRLCTWPGSPLEEVEKIECLRYLENGLPIRMVLTDFMGIEIDTPDDLKKAERLM
ncbi:MAG: hypothetical protein NVS1B13_02090 [Flavisolibacter sp.]